MAKFDGCLPSISFMCLFPSLCMYRTFPYTSSVCPFTISHLSSSACPSTIHCLPFSAYFFSIFHLSIHRPSTVLSLSLHCFPSSACSATIPYQSFSDIRVVSSADVSLPVPSRRTHQIKAGSVSPTNTHTHIHHGKSGSQMIKCPQLYLSSRI